MPNDSLRLTEYQAHQMDLKRKATRERIAKEEAMDPLMNGHSPEVSQDIRTIEQVIVELLEMIVKRLPHGGSEMPDEVRLYKLLKALKGMINE